MGKPRTPNPLRLRHEQTTLLADRIDRAVAALCLAPARALALQRIILPEEFAPPRAAVATASRPGTAARVSAMQARARLKLPLKCFSDPGPADDRTAVEYVLMVRLTADTEDGARAEARRLLGRDLGGGRRTHKGLPAGASIEAV